MLGFSYDLKDYVKGLSVTCNFARGTDAVDPAQKSGLPDENEDNEEAYLLVKLMRALSTDH